MPTTEGPFAYVHMLLLIVENDLRCTVHHILVGEEHTTALLSTRLP